MGDGRQLLYNQMYVQFNVAVLVNLSYQMTNFTWITCKYYYWGMAMTNTKGHESTSYETILVVAGLLFIFTIVNMKGPNKQLNHKKSLSNF